MACSSCSLCSNLGCSSIRGWDIWLKLVNMDSGLTHDWSITCNPCGQREIAGFLKFVPMQAFHTNVAQPSCRYCGHFTLKCPVFFMLFLANWTVLHMNIAALPNFAAQPLAFSVLLVVQSSDLSNGVLGLRKWPMKRGGEMRRGSATMCNLQAGGVDFLFYSDHCFLLQLTHFAGLFFLQPEQISTTAQTAGSPIDINLLWPAWSITHWCLLKTKC